MGAEDPRADVRPAGRKEMVALGASITSGLELGPAATVAAAAAVLQLMGNEQVKDKADLAKTAIQQGMSSSDGLVVANQTNAPAPGYTASAATNDKAGRQV